MASQVAAGEENAPTLRVYGTEAGLEWRQEEPDALHFKPLGGPEQVLKRGSEYLCEAAKEATRVPPGHPEAFIEAFANVYAGVVREIRGEPGGDFPTVHDGARGAHFVERVVESARSDRKWTDARWQPTASAPESAASS